MPTRRVGILGAALLVLSVVVAILIYRTANGRAFSWPVGDIVIVQATVIACLVVRSVTVRYRVILAILGLTGVAAAMLAPALPARFPALAMAGVCHAGAYALLLTRFATSLRPGREPVVTRLARQLRKTMPIEVVRYTRLVTIVWCIFFAIQLAVSAGLLFAATETAWSTFVTLWNLPLVVAMMLAEFGCRSLMFRREPHTGMIATLAGLRHISFVVGKPP
jgi:uncharacterized membrane protein